MKLTNEKKTAIIAIVLFLIIIMGFVSSALWVEKEYVSVTNNDNQQIETSVTTAKKVSTTITQAPIESAKPTTKKEPITTVKQTPEPTPVATPTPIPRNAVHNDPVRALYLSAYTVASSLDHYINLANRTEINAYVIDIKTDSGQLVYGTNIQEAIDAGAKLDIYDAESVIQKLHDNDIIVIARLVTFKDNLISAYDPSLTLKKLDGSVYKKYQGNNYYSTFLDPSNKDTWIYMLKIVNEAAELGFDEIQFDYIRYPVAGSASSNYLTENDLSDNHKNIENFIAYIHKNLAVDIELSADIFGMPLITDVDYGNIGQTLETIGWNLDYICPMIYPSHYANNAKTGSMSNGVGQTINGVHFNAPDLKPYEVLYNNLALGKKRIDAIDDYNLDVRAYLQGFTASYLPDGYYMTYGVDEYRAQIQAVYDAGYDSWIFWNAGNVYVENAFLPK